MEYYEVRNWSEYQHYTDRNPPWIKLHYDLLTSPDWVMLADASRLLAVVCMLIASRHDGKVPADPGYVKRIAYLNKEPDFSKLVECGFLLSASTCEHLQADATVCVQMQRTSVSVLSSLKKEEEVLEYLNKKFSSKFKRTEEIRKCLVREKVDIIDCRKVIDLKCEQWSKDPKMSKHLNPTTLFRRANFAGYLDEANSAPEPYKMATTLPEL